VRDINYADVLTMYHYIIGTHLADGRLDSDKFDRCSTKLREWEYQGRESAELGVRG
jgi:hypothetical protein